ncbi:MAG: redoxin domain-containing protein [Planctomycetes bacterium]|nr:redoxin domain-containing protein [Planctomycetota bacterium]
MTHQKNTHSNTPREDWEDIQSVFDQSTQPDTQPLKSLLENFRNDLRHHPYVRAGQRNTTLAAAQWLIWIKRLAAPATTLAVIALTLSFLSQPTPTWGQVVAKFQDMNFFSASIYSKENGLSKPEHIELWMGQGGKVRMRLGTQLIFAEKGEILAAFDLKSRKQTDPNHMGTALIRLLGSDETFSMDTVLKSIAQGSPINKTPVLNENAMISDDLAVFDLESQEHSMWFRIWALRKTGLPVRIRMWNPSDAESMEVLFDYSEPQSERFFDPKAFASVLGTIRTGQLNLAYLYLEDAGGKLYVPGITDQSKAMDIVTTMLGGEPFSLSHYADKTLVLYFWNRGSDERDWRWIRQKQAQYSDRQDVKLVIVSLDKNTSRVERDIASYQIDLTVLHEPGKGLTNSLARALGVKHERTFWLLRKGQAVAMQPVPALNDEMLTLACDGLGFESARWLTQFIKMFETTQDQMRDLCGPPHNVEIVDGTALWHYQFTSKDQKRKKSITLRFKDKDKGLYSGVAISNRLIHPSHMCIQFNQAFWDNQVVPALGQENMPVNNPDARLEIAMARRNTRSIIGGGHPQVIIEPDREYKREMEDGTYTLYLQSVRENKYERLAQLELLDPLVIEKNESVSLHFEDTAPPIITRSQYSLRARDIYSETRQGMLKEPDHKKRIKELNKEEQTYDDPKYLPWQLHLKQIAARYADRPLPERMELWPKGTDEAFAFTMFPKELPGYDGFRAISKEGDLKERFRGHPFGPGVMRWPDDTPSITLNHDLVYRDNVSQKEEYTFILEQLGYTIEKVTEDRTVFVATYDGRPLPDPETVSAPRPGGWGYFTANRLINTLTRAHDPNCQAKAPVFIDETNLPFKPGPGQTYQDMAISMEMPGINQDFEALRPWFADTFGITFTQEIRPMEILVIRKRQ